MKKRGMITLFIIIALILISFILFTLLNSQKSEIEVQECQTDSNCVPSTCCHASSCIPENQAPDCSDSFCTLSCEPGTLDCNQGNCKCINKKCEAIFNE